MIWIYIVLALAAWFGCGLLSAGFTFAYFQRKYPYLAERDRRKDMGFAQADILFGPIALLVTWDMCCFRYRWMRPW